MSDKRLIDANALRQKIEKWADSADNSISFADSVESFAYDEVLDAIDAAPTIDPEALQQLAAGYDRIYIDTPPALNFYTRSALIGARGCLIPFDCDDFSRKALYTLLENVQEIQADHNPDLVVEGIVVNQFQARANLPQRIVDELIAEGLPVLTPYLPSSIRVRESHEQSLPMIYLDPGHKLTQAFVALHAALPR